MNRVTQAQIAREVGLSVATVSRTLANDPRVDAATAGRVRAVAERLGYRPDPAFSWMAEVRWRGGKGCQRLNLAFIFQFRQHASDKRLFYHGAETHAAELGYGLDQFFMEDYPDSGALQRILIARGIRGIIVGPLFKSEPTLELDWSKFCTVGCGHGHFEPTFHVVTYDPYEAIMVAWRRALAYGYRLPGLVIPLHAPPVCVDDDENRRAAALLCHDQGAPGGNVPPLCYSFGDPYEVLVKRMRSWFRKWKPDAVLGLNDMPLGILQHEFKVRVPGEVGFAQFADTDPEQQGIAGIKDSAEDIGRASVDLLQLILRTNQWGLPKTRIRHYVEPEWIDGETLPRRAGTKA